MGFLSMLDPFGGGGGGGFSGGGVGNSASTSSQQTENADMRIVGGDSSINTSQKINIGSSNTGPITISSTDHGAIAAGAQIAQSALGLGGHVVDDNSALALAALQNADKQTTQVIAANGSLLDSALHNMADLQSGFTQTIDNIKTNDKTLLIAGLVVIGALYAAGAMFKRG
jgi:hypothetical protein